MVRRERRSLAAGTTSSVQTQSAIPASMPTRVRLICVLVCIVSWLQAPREIDALDAAVAANYADETDIAVGHSAHEPKFGERLLPLRKKNAGAAAGSGGGNPSSGNLATDRSVNSLLSKSNYNYIVSRESASASVNSARVRHGAARSVATGMDAPAPDRNVAYKVSVNSLDAAAAAAGAAAATAAEDDVDMDVDVHMDESDENFLLARQPKQLMRREDNVADTTLLQGNVSKADRLEMSTEFFVIPTTTTTTSTTTATMANSRAGTRGSPRARGVPGGSGGGYQPNFTRSGGAANASVTPPTIVSTAHPPFMGLRKEPWVVPVLVLASLTMLMMGAFEIFVLFKAWRTSPSRRHLFLGQMLLLGLFACASLGAVITAQPSLLSCGAIRFGVGVSYALVFAALLVKCVFLISLNGGVYLPACYQGLLLLFAVLIQVAIGAQWLLTQPPEIYTTSVPIVGNGFLSSTVASHTNYTALFYPTAYTTPDGPEIYTRIAAVSTILIPLCKTQFSELLFSLIYIVFLIVFIAVLAIKSRGIRDNYREATYIGLAIGGAIPIWLGWMLCGLAVAERHKDACIAFGLVATSATVFLVMFMPKGRQLAAMGKEGLYVEDREEQFSSLSRAGSGYSPSFFHFKPIKYGVMGGGLQNSATNTGNGASTKHCSNVNNGAGDRVALVTAAPPSYTRMYHYFPAHLTAHPFCYYPQPPPLPPPQIAPPPTITQLPSPLTLKQLGNSLSSMTQAHIAKTLRYPGMFIRPDETNLYTTLEPTLSSNPNVYFQRGGAVHPGMMY